MTGVKRKRCRRCGKGKELGEFYAHPGKLDGHDSHCIECIKDARRKRYQKNRDTERQRKKTPESRESNRLAVARYNSKNPEKRLASSKVFVALGTGQLEKEGCLFCWSPTAEAHHEDYEDPLDVNWLCTRCHNYLHRERKDAQCSNN